MTALHAPAPLPAGPALSDLRTCIHCGMCLEACPTYRVSGLETESPRGRIHLMQLLVEGRAQPTGDVTVHLDRCLACRACETVCPAGVPYGRLIESARASLAQATRPSSLVRALRWLAFRWLLPHPARLDAAARLLAVYERSGLPAVLRRTGLLRRLPPRLRMLEGLRPPLTRPRFSRQDGGVVFGDGVQRGRVAMLTGCVMRVAYGDVNEATARLLARVGYEVVVPAGQRCCGALHAHAGDVDGARELARGNVERFAEVAGLEWIVVNAAGCGAHLKKYAELLADDPEWAERARLVAARVRDLSEVLEDSAERLSFGRLPLRITYQDPCHLAHAQGIRDQPRALLRRVPELELVEMREADRCCGSAGIYNITQADYSARVLAAKMGDLLATRPQAVVTSNPGCMLQLRYGLERAGVDVPVYHLAEVLERSAAAAARSLS